MEKKLGKISEVKFGLVGYQKCMFGLFLDFDMQGICLHTTISNVWDPETIPTDVQTQWTEEDRDKQLSDMCRKISKLLSDAKVDDVYKLKGIPVEVTIDGNTFKEFRILTEVL